jgi:hypothetical protein
LLVTADAGGSNSYRSRVWKAELQQLANEAKLAIAVTHFPPGTSKWNKVEHRLFSHITMNWSGRPLEDYETVVQLIGSTKTRTGLEVKADLDCRTYETGLTVADSVIQALNITPATFHGDWNYPQPRPRQRGTNSSHFGGCSRWYPRHHQWLGRPRPLVAAWGTCGAWLDPLGGNSCQGAADRRPYRSPRMTWSDICGTAMQPSLESIPIGSHPRRPCFQHRGQIRLTAYSM